MVLYNMIIYKKVFHLIKKPYKNYVLYRATRYAFLNRLLTSIRCNDILGETLSRPIMLACETVNTCTNSCIICPYEKMTREKATMSIIMFEKVLHDYSAIGGGCLTLTPKNGEVFLDNLLEERLELLDKYPKIKYLSITTNAIPIDRFSDDPLRKILNYFDRIHISIYGLDPEEYSMMTRRDYYHRMISNIKRIIKFRNINKTELLFGFRFLKSHSKNDIDDWIKRNFEIDIPYGYTDTYMDWNGALDERNALPWVGNWKKRAQGDSHCLIPLILGMVYSNGDVSYCPCNDFDICEEFKLGNINDKSLSEIFNSEKNMELWRSLPEKCVNCSSYRPMANFDNYSDLFEDPVKYIGG